MELDWTTFLLEIVNFLVLVWLLKRFLYRPVLDSIAQRKLDIEKRVADSQLIRKEAESLREQYERRIADWEQEKATARSRVLEEVGAERTRLMAGLRASLEQERAKSRALEQQRLNELSRQVEETALVQGAQFAAALLSRLATADLETQVVRVVLDDLRKLPEEQRQAMRAAAAESAMSSTITSAYQLGPGDRQALAEAFASLVGCPVSCTWRQDPELKAGLHIRLGTWILSANLRDELKFFREASLRAVPTPAADS
jgi:F-type H+-transporting ATPase subunit b